MARLNMPGRQLLKSSAGGLSRSSADEGASGSHAREGVEEVGAADSTHRWARHLARIASTQPPPVPAVVRHALS